MKIEDLGEGKQKLTLFKPDVIMAFADFYNDWIFKSEDKRTSIDDKELKPLRALVHFGRKATPDAKGVVKVNLTQMQNESMRELSYLFSPDEVNSLAEKKVTGDVASGDGGLFVSYNFQDIEMLFTYWEIIHACRKITNNG